MKRIRRVLSASMALGLALSLGVSVPAFAALTFTGGTIVGHPSYTYTQPVIDGRYVALVRETIATGEYDVVVYNRQTGTQRVFTAGDGIDQDDVAISGTEVAWIEHSGPGGTGEVMLGAADGSHVVLHITNDSADDVGPVIDGQLLVWVDGITPGRQIHWYDMDMERAGVVPGTNLPNGVCVDKGRICWYDIDKNPGYEGVYMYEPGTDAETTVHEVDSASRGIEPTSIDIQDDHVVWTQWWNSEPTNTDIWAERLSTHEYGAVTTNTSAQQNPAVFGDLLPWQDNRFGNQDILAWWEPEPGYQQVAWSALDQVYPDVYGRSIVYQVGTASGSDIGLSKAPLVPKRLSGANRYATAAAISANRFTKSGAAVLATGENFPDALAASALAGALDCPLLLTGKYDVPGPIVAELDRLGAGFVFIVGGTSSITAGVEADLTAAGISFERIAGANRYATARSIAGYVVDILGNNNEVFREEAFFVRGDNFADALAVAPHAYAMGIPILLVRSNGVPTETRDAILGLNIKRGYVIGGTAAISASTQAALDALLPGDTQRWAGASRYETAAICADNGFRRGWLDYDTIGVATGANFPDALGGGAACGAYGSPIVLTAPTYVPAAVDTFLKQRRFDFGGMEVYGGTASVSPATLTQLGSYLN